MRHQRFVEGCAGRAVARALYVTALVALAATSSVAQMKEKPRTFAMIDNSQDQVERRVLPPINRDLLVEDRTRRKDQQRPVPAPFAGGADKLSAFPHSGTLQTRHVGRIV